MSIVGAGIETRFARCASLFLNTVAIANNDGCAEYLSANSRQLGGKSQPTDGVMMHPIML